MGNGVICLVDLKNALDQSRNEIDTNLTTTLKDYFDPTSGRFQERVERLIRQDGDLSEFSLGKIVLSRR